MSKGLLCLKHCCGAVLQRCDSSKGDQVSSTGENANLGMYVSQHSVRAFLIGLYSRQKKDCKSARPSSLVLSLVVRPAEMHPSPKDHMEGPPTGA